MDKIEKETIESNIRGFVMTKKCDKCGEEIKANMFPYINFTVNPEYFQPVKDLAIFKTVCPHCGKENRYTFDTMLVNEKDKWIVYLLNNEDNKDKFKYQIRYFMETEINKDGTKDLDSFTTRLVFRQNDVVEKLSIFQYGLNDKIIELLKNALYDKEIFDRNKYDVLYFDSIYQEEQSLIFVGISTRSSTIEPKIMGVKYNFYNDLIDKIGGIEKLKDREMFDVIDSAWAEQYTK